MIVSFRSTQRPKQGYTQAMLQGILIIYAGLKGFCQKIETVLHATNFNLPPLRRMIFEKKPTNLRAKLLFQPAF